MLKSSPSLLSQVAVVSTFLSGPRSLNTLRSDGVNGRNQRTNEQGPAENLAIGFHILFDDNIKAAQWPGCVASMRLLISSSLSALPISINALRFGYTIMVPYCGPADIGYCWLVSHY